MQGLPPIPNISDNETNLIYTSDLTNLCIKTNFNLRALAYALVSNI